MVGIWWVYGVSKLFPTIISHREYELV